MFLHQGSRLVKGLKPRHYFWGVAILLVTGLDLLPAVTGYWFSSSYQAADIVSPSIEWWNEQVSAWVGAVLWVPHHIVGFTVCMFAFLLINERFTATHGRQNSRIYLLIATLALASSFGMSIWVTFVAAIALANLDRCSAPHKTNRRGITTCCHRLLDNSFCATIYLRIATGSKC